MYDPLQTAAPHSEESERAVLASVLLQPAVLEDLPLSAADFYDPRHQVLYQAFEELAAEETPIDLRTLQARLEERGELDDVGGIAFLAALDLDLPDIGNVDAYARIVRDRALRRRLVGAARRLAGRVVSRATELGPLELAAQMRRELEDLEGAGGGRVPLWASDLVPQVLEEAHRRREQRREQGSGVLGVSTGIPRLDALLGGLERGLLLLAGPPGAGKTTLAFQMACHALEEVPVVYVSFENSPASLVSQALCRQAGIHPVEVQRGWADVAPLEQAYQELAPRLERLVPVEGDGELTVGRLRSLARQALERHGARRCLVVVDYLQLWAKTSRELRGLTDTRARVDALGGELVTLARRLGSPVLALSSQSRSGGNYGRGGGQAALDSLKESGDLEYSADVAMFLTPSQDRQAPPPAVALDLTISKHRHGPTGQVPLVFAKDRGLLREEAIP